MADKDQTVLTLYTGKQRVVNQHSWSPFVGKLHARLRFSGLSFNVDAGSKTEAPKGKLPYVKIHGTTPSSSGSLMGDSTLITKKLIEDGMIEDLNTKMSSLEQAQDVAFRALLEDKIYFLTVYERWIETDNFYQIRDVGPLSPIPYPLRVIIGILAYRSVNTLMNAQGTGRHTAEERTVLKTEGWQAINDLVSTSQAKLTKAKRGKGQIAWALGYDKPTELDATLFGFLSSIFVCTGNPETLTIMKKFPALVRYASEIHDEYFPDYEKWEIQSREK